MCLGVKEQHKVDKFEGEDEMLRRYEFHMELMKKFKDLTAHGSWRSLLDMAEGEQELKVGGGGKIEGLGKQ